MTDDPDSVHVQTHPVCCNSSCVVLCLWWPTLPHYLCTVPVLLCQQ